MTRCHSSSLGLCIPYSVPFKAPNSSNILIYFIPEELSLLGYNITRGRRQFVKAEKLENVGIRLQKLPGLGRLTLSPLRVDSPRSNSAT